MNFKSMERSGRGLFYGTVPAIIGWTEGNVEEPLSCCSLIAGCVLEHCDLIWWVTNGHAHPRIGFIRLIKTKMRNKHKEVDNKERRKLLNAC